MREVEVVSPEQVEWRLGLLEVLMSRPWEPLLLPLLFRLSQIAVAIRVK